MKQMLIIGFLSIIMMIFGACGNTSQEDISSAEESQITADSMETEQDSKGEAQMIESDLTDRKGRCLFG